MVTDPDRAGRALVTVFVDDLDDRIAGVQARGIPVPEIDNEIPGVRRARLDDPEGNRITFGEVAPPV